MRYVVVIVFLLLSFGPATFAETSSSGIIQISPASQSGGRIDKGGFSRTLINPLGQGATLSSFVSSILQLVVKIGSIVIIFMIIYVGFLFVVARGESGKIITARRALLYTLIGALVLLGAQAIALGIQATVQALSTGG